MTSEVPSPSGLRSVSLPPMAFTGSMRPMIPEPSAGSAPPSPSSSMASACPAGTGAAGRSRPRSPSASRRPHNAEQRQPAGASPRQPRGQQRRRPPPSPRPWLPRVATRRSAAYSRQPLDLGPCLAIGDRRGHELGEDGQTVQGIGGQRRALVAGRHHHRTPDTTADQHGNVGRHTDVELPRRPGNGAPDLRVVIDSVRLAGPLHRDDDARVTGRAGLAPTEIERDLARPGDHRGHAFPARSGRARHAEPRTAQRPRRRPR